MRNVSKNKRGFSLVELMVVVSIMGILSAIAIPSYLSYQDDAREGVIKSMLHMIDRIVDMELMLGKKLNQMSADLFKSKINSEAKGQVDISDPQIVSKNWCVSIEGKSTSEYKGMKGCVSGTSESKNKVVRVGTQEVECSSYTFAGHSCPAGCTIPQGTGVRPCGGGTFASYARCRDGVCEARLN